MARIDNAVLILILSLAAGACSSMSSRSTRSELAFPRGQCELRITGSPDAIPSLISSCGGGTIGSNGPALLALAETSRIFFQRGLESVKVADGLELAEETRALYAAGGRIGRIQADKLPAEAKRLLERPRYVFIAIDDDRIKVSFHGGSDALVTYRQADRSIVADYVVY